MDARLDAWISMNQARDKNKSTVTHYGVNTLQTLGFNC